MSTETIDIVVKENGSAAAAQNIQNIGTAAQKSGTQVEAFGGIMKEVSQLLLLAGVTFGIKQLFDYDQQFQKLENTLRQVTSSTKELTDVENQLFNISQNTRTSFGSNVDLYNKFESSLVGLTHTSKDTLTAISNVDKILTASGLSADEAQGALQQLAYVMSTGTVNGRGLQEVLRTVPELGRAIANNLEGGTSVSIGHLKELADAGKLTTKVLLDTFTNAGFAQQAQAMFSNVQTTVGQAFTVLTNSIQRFIGQLDQANGASNIMAQSILFLANHLPQIASVLEIVASAWVAVKVAALAAAAAEALATGGFSLIIPAIGAAVSWILQFGQSIKLTEDHSISLRGALVGTFNFIVASLPDILNGFKKFGDLLLQGGEYLVSLYDGSTLQALVVTIENAATATARWVANLYQGSLLQEVVNAISAAFVKLYEVIVDTGVKLGILSADGPSIFEKMRSAVADWKASMEQASAEPPKIQQKMHAMAQSVAHDFSDLTSAIDPLQKAIDDAFNQNMIDALKPDLSSLKNVIEDTGSAARDFGSSLSQGLSSAQGPAQAMNSQLDRMSRTSHDIADTWKTVGGVVFNNSGVLTSHDINPRMTFASGGSFKVGGVGGVDSQLVKFMASPDERVTVETPSQQRANGKGGDTSIHVAMTVNATDADSFKSNQKQLSMALQSQLTRALRSIT